MREVRLNFVEHFQVSTWYWGTDSLFQRCWGGAQETLQQIRKSDLWEDFFYLCQDLWGEEEIDLEQFNDWLWFDRNSIYESLGLSEDGTPIVSEETPTL